jgi:CHAT domain-containing protein
MAIHQYGEQNDDVADILAMRGHLYLSQRLYEKALLDFQRMLATVVPGASPTHYRTMPEVQNENPYFKNIITAYFRKGDAFFAWFNDSKNPEHLTQAVSNYRAAYRHIIIARQSIDDEASKPHILSYFSESVNNSIACAHTLYRKTKDQKYIDDMLYFVELTKYLNVLDALQRAERANQSEIPVNLLFDLETTRRELNQLQQVEWRQEHLSLSRDSVASLRDQILKLIDRRRDLTAQISRYTGHQRVDTAYVATLGAIQEHLREDEHIVEFFWGRDSIYTLSITDRSAEAFVIPNSVSMDSLLRATHMTLEGKRSYRPESIEAYSRMTSTIYHRLFEPLTVRKKMIVIPDGPLNLIPVEALVVDHRSTGLSFKALDYFIYHQEILYAYSSSILYYKPLPGLKAIENVLAFSYSGDGKATFDRSNSQSALPGTFKEAQSLTRIFKHVTNFAGQDALKSNFVQRAQHYDLIHLGIHGLGSPDVADNARLIFRGDSLESGDLYAYDIYNLKMDARLVVLSACETGVGKQQTGEGIFSIARAFSYAGCPSVVMSMWRAPDDFTATMMERFYEKLHDGNSISVSLRESKLQFLDESDEFLAHPSNWATFVLNGRDQSFKKQTPAAIWILLGAAGVALLFALLKWRARHRIKN